MLILGFNYIVDTLGWIKHVIKISIASTFLNVTTRKFKIVYVAVLFMSVEQHCSSEIENRLK